MKNSYIWGLDLSGTEQGAGGVGGLLFFSQVSGAQPSTHFVGHDGNGNVILLADAASGIATAEYEYSPFGKVVRATGSMALVNPFRFSTKYQDDETGFNYYGLRFYNPDTGRWLNRDPIEEDGGINVYGFVNNQPTMLVDGDGRIPPIVIVIGIGLGAAGAGCKNDRELPAYPEPGTPAMKASRHACDEEEKQCKDKEGKEGSWSGPCKDLCVACIDYKCSNRENFQKCYKEESGKCEVKYKGRR